MNLVYYRAEFFNSTQVDLLYGEKYSLTPRTHLFTDFTEDKA